MAEIALRADVASQEEVVRMALDKFEESLFWEGFEEKAAAYLKASPEEDEERARFAGTLADGLEQEK